MHKATKLLLILTMLMAYLPMSMAYAMSDGAMQEEMQSEMAMDMENCHEQQVEPKCGHCADQHNCNSAFGSCSTSFGLASYSYDLAIKQKLNSWYLAFHVNTPLQHSLALFRPPISL